MERSSTACEERQHIICCLFSGGDVYRGGLASHHGPLSDLGGTDLLAGPGTGVDLAAPGCEKGILLARCSS